MSYKPARRESRVSLPSIRAKDSKQGNGGGEEEEAQGREGVALPRLLPSLANLAPVVLARDVAGHWKHRTQDSGYAGKPVFSGPDPMAVKARAGPSFAVGKHGISRVVVHFSKPPVSQPHTLCFGFPRNILTHRYVLDTLNKAIRGFLGNDKENRTRILTVQFVDRNVIHGALGLDNRWLVTLNNGKVTEQILKVGISLYNRRVDLKRYDDVIAVEYEEFQVYMERRDRMFKGIPEEERNAKRVRRPESSRKMTAKASTKRNLLDNNPPTLVSEDIIHESSVCAEDGNNENGNNQ